jgi:DeoR/GlpR family transcriptional regulator of sugar metabolism
VENGDAIAFGPGSSTLSLARRLITREGLTVVTNSILVSQALQDAPGIHLVLSGGLVRSATHALVGPIAEQSLAGLFVTTLFLSGNGLTAARGLSTPDVLTAAVDRRLVASAGRVVVLADHTKVGVETMSLTVGTTEIDCVITDDLADKDEVARLREAGVEVLVAAST